MRAYITDCRDKEPVGRLTPVEVFFSFQTEIARSWRSREQAEYLCSVLDSYSVKVDWAEGGKYVCKDFQVEQRASQEFLIFCDGPFTALPNAETTT